jgi:hypothetical protein
MALPDKWNYVVPTGPKSASNVQLGSRFYFRDGKPICIVIFDNYQRPRVHIRSEGTEFETPDGSLCLVSVEDSGDTRAQQPLDLAHPTDALTTASRSTARPSGTRAATSGLGVQD